VGRLDCVEGRRRDGQRKRDGLRVLDLQHHDELHLLLVQPPVHQHKCHESITMVANYTENMIGSMNVTVSLTTYGSTKLSIRPSMSVNGNSSLRMFGDGSM
jgi:hypothetical protein